MGKFHLFFSQLPKAANLLLHREKMQDLLRKALHVLRDEKSLESVRAEALLLLDMVKDTVTHHYRYLGKRNAVLIVGALLYLLNPMDVIPDFIVGLGFTDDIGILTYVFHTLHTEIEKYRQWIADGRPGDRRPGDRRAARTPESDGRRSRRR
ncbi:YkvA family protein [Levyella massiliensis]|uniref:YkvA family protein n=1 Tax=Levyella massiliensis TaxID=938289 RepID=UPI003EBAA6D2